MTTQLTPTALQLYEFLKETGGAWENKCMRAIWPATEYPDKEHPDRENLQRAYWQYDVNMYGYKNISRPVGDSVEIFNATDDYSRKLSAAYQELRRAGLAGERNSGYNDYYFFPLK